MVREENPENVFVSKAVSLFIDGLKEKHLYNYSELYQYHVTVYASEENINRLLDHYHNSIKREMEVEEQSEIESLQEQLDQVTEENTKLEEQNSELESKVTEYQDKLNSYKQNLESLLQE